MNKPKTQKTEEILEDYTCSPVCYMPTVKHVLCLTNGNVALKDKPVKELAGMVKEKLGWPEVSDFKPFEHGQEGTHGACQYMVALMGDKAECCTCSGHDCYVNEDKQTTKKDSPHVITVSAKAMTNILKMKSPLDEQPDKQCNSHKPCKDQPNGKCSVHQKDKQTAYADHFEFSNSDLKDKQTDIGNTQATHRQVAHDQPQHDNPQEGCKCVCHDHKEDVHEHYCDCCSPSTGKGWEDSKEYANAVGSLLLDKNADKLTAFISQVEQEAIAQTKAQIVERVKGLRRVRHPNQSEGDKQFERGHTQALNDAIAVIQGGKE